MSAGEFTEFTQTDYLRAEPATSDYLTTAVARPLAHPHRPQRERRPAPARQGTHPNRAAHPPVSTPSIPQNRSGQPDLHPSGPTLRMPGQPVAAPQP
jgi:hypothetical protein